ncbi:MAG: hypothetical protein EZS28_040552, partial [Streblomastix strix]
MQGKKRFRRSSPQLEPVKQDIAADIIEALVKTPGKITQVSQLYNITTQRIYTIAYCYCMEQNQALVKARALGLQPVIDRFSRVLELPTATYLREFLQSQSISMCKGNDVTSEKKQALYSSNIKHWNNKIYTLDIAKGVRPRCFVNMDETEINAENDALVAKIRGL